MAGRILVIEDSPVIQQLVAVSLRPLGAVVDARHDGVSGLAAVLESPPDVLVLDIGLPGMSGWEVLKHIRADMQVRHTKVLVLTAHAQEETRTKADQIGADKFMTKPFQPDLLRRAVAELLGEACADGPPPVVPRTASSGLPPA